MKGRFVLPALGLMIMMIASLLQGSLWPIEENVNEVLLGPSGAHFLGTDSLGRDLLYRCLQGSRISLLIGILTTTLSFLFGILYAVFAARVGGRLEVVMMRFVEVLMALPSIVSMAVMTLLFSNIWVDRSQTTQIVILVLSLSLTSWMWVARQIRSWIEPIRKLEFVQAARALGVSETRILIRHVLPQINRQLFVFVGLLIPQMLMFESFLSFVGIGVQSPSTSWGILIQEGWRTLSVYPHLLFGPSFFLFTVVFCFNLLFRL